MKDFGLEVHLSKWEFAARHHMTASDVQSMSIRELLDLAGDKARDDLLNCPLGYTENPGCARSVGGDCRHI